MTVEMTTFLAQLGNRSDQATGAVSAPIYLSTTYAHPELGQSTGYDYTRTKNPTRELLESGLATLENGARGIVTSSGMSAIALIFELFPSGSEFLVSRDLYGGSYRFFEELQARQIAYFHYFNTLNELEEQISSTIAAVFLETPTNPLMTEIDVSAVAEIAHQVNALLIVDNTFLTPLRQKPLELGADLVLHSGTKFLTGHNDILAGVIIAKEVSLGERLTYLANTTGPTLSSFDCWLFIRSLKTLPLRFERQEQNAKEITAFLKRQPAIKDVLYPGVGGMISLWLKEAVKVRSFLKELSIFTFAESLGGVESLITYPTTQTHADIPKELRESYGLTPDLLRLSIGIENSQDLIADLTQALSYI